MRVVLTALAAAAAFIAACVDASTQFHLSLAGDADYMLDWVAPTADELPVLLYGSSSTALDKQIVAKSAGTVEQSAGAEVTCWTALLHNLSPGETVYYSLKGGSEVKTFSVPAASVTWAVFGDLAAPMQKQAAGVSLPALKTALASGAYQGVLNLGDISYELVKANGENYMDEIEEIGSQVPIQATIGNHEHQYAMAPEFALQNYHRRFHGLRLGAGTKSGSYSNEFYSFSSGLIHFVFINTEIYGDQAFFHPQADGSWLPDEAARRAMAKSQMDWLEYDLSRVDRAVTPYVVMCGHRPPFKTPDGLSVAGNKFIEEVVPLMSTYDVDLYLSGHEHTYITFDESTVAGFRIPPIIISGSSGNNEYIRQKEQIKMKGFTEKTIIPKYGFGYLTATAEALEWKWGSTATDSSTRPQPKDWELEDEVTIPRRAIASAAEKKGTPVDEPRPIEADWTSAGKSGANSGSIDEDASKPGTVAPGGEKTSSPSTTKTPASTPSSAMAAFAMTPLFLSAIVCSVLAVV